jgi:hypothetical protein
VDELLDPELGDLMLDDEEHLVVVGRAGEGALLGEELRQAEVSRVAEPVGEVGDDTGLERPLILLHYFSFIHLVSIWGRTKECPAAIVHSRQAREAYYPQENILACGSKCTFVNMETTICITYEGKCSACDTPGFHRQVIP